MRLYSVYRLRKNRYVNTATAATIATAMRAMSVSRSRGSVVIFFTASRVAGSTPPSCCGIHSPGLSRMLLYWRSSTFPFEASWFIGGS